MINSKAIVVVAVALGLGSLSVYSFLSGSKAPDEQKEKKSMVVRRKLVRDGKTKFVKRGRNRNITRVSTKSDVKRKEKPTFDIEDAEVARLTEEQRRLLDAIRKALDENNENAVLSLVRRLQKSKEWPDGIPKSIKVAAIDALGWFGSSCLPEIVGFLADGDQDVIQTAVEKYEEALSDMDLSDRERAVILVEAGKVITDAEAMDMMLFELNNMRHSVAIGAIKELLATAGEATQSVLRENIEFYTCEEGLDTPEKLDEWLEQNPDDPDDEEFYGAQQ